VTPGDEPGQTLRLGVLTDLHLAAIGTPAGRFNNIVRLGASRALLAAAVAWLVPKVDALALLGDLTQAATADDYRYLRDRLGETGLPAYLVPGNHDFPVGSRSAAVPGAAFRPAPAGPIVFGPDGIRRGPVLIASARLESSGGWFQLSPPEVPRPASGTGQPLVFLTHFPVLAMRSAIERRGWRFAGDLTNRPDVEHALTRCGRPVIVLAGHLHVRGHVIAGNILQLSMGALAEAPHDASVVSVADTGDALRVTRQCHPLAADDGGGTGAVLDPSYTSFVWQDQNWREDTPSA
jgi:hypothetical protein